jgi:DNA-binding PadR family transcriptional regulator
MAFQVLLALADADRHGYGIIREVDQRTGGKVRLRTGSLYTLLQRLLEAQLVEPILVPTAAEGHADGYRDDRRKDDSRRRYYRLAPLGREVLRAEARRLESLVSDAQRKQVLGGESKVWP